MVNQNDSDNSLPREVEDVCTDLETLPESGNGGKSDNIAAE